MSSTRVRPSSFVPGAWAGASIAALGATYFYRAHAFDGPVLCPFRLVSGLPCPGCGMTRAFSLLWQGRVLESLSFHALAPLAFAVFCLLPLAYAAERWTGPWDRLPPLRTSRALAWAIASLMMVHHAVRLAWWWYDGTLYGMYFHPSWLGRLLDRAFG